MKEKDGVLTDKKKLQTEMERLIHQMHCREEIISVITKTLETHDLLDREPRMAAALAQLQEQISQLQIPIPAAGRWADVC